MSDANTTNVGALVDNSVFIVVSFGLIGNTKKVKADKEGTGIAGTLSVSTDADIHLLRAQKTLIESPELEAIRKADAKLRTWLKDDICLPYDVGGMMVCPNALLPVVYEKLENYKNIERPALVSALTEAYPMRVQEALAKLGTLGNISDYHDATLLPSLFSFAWQFISFAVPESLKKAGLFEKEQAKMQEKFAEATAEITAVMRETLLDTVSHLQKALTPSEDGKQKKLFKSSVANVQDFLETFDARNITNDAELAAVVEKARALVDGVSVEGLRKSDEFKEKLRAGMESIAGQLSGMVETVQGRKIRL